MSCLFSKKKKEDFSFEDESVSEEKPKIKKIEGKFECIDSLKSIIEKNNKGWFDTFDDNDTIELFNSLTDEFAEKLEPFIASHVKFSQQFKKFAKRTFKLLLAFRNTSEFFNKISPRFENTLFNSHEKRPMYFSPSVIFWISATMSSNAVIK